MVVKDPYSVLRKVSYQSWALDGEVLSVKLNALDFVKSLRFQIALPAVRTSHHRDVFYNQKTFSFAICSGNFANMHTLFSTNFTYHLIIAFLWLFVSVKINSKNPFIILISCYLNLSIYFIGLSVH